MKKQYCSLHPINRAKILFSIIIILVLSTNNGMCQNELDVIHNNWIKYSDASNSLYQHLSLEATKLLQKRADENLKIKNIKGWEKHQKETLNKLWDVLGAFPEKTPLNAKITGTVQKSGYRIENIIFESLPKYYVTASIFIPDQIQKPSPAILFCSGHSSGVYRLPGYQMPLLNLVKKGFIVLAIDPAGQGERLQYYSPETKASVIGSSTREHSYPSAQVFISGKSIARYFAWDGIRAIDYLVSRPEVDPKRIGVHGLSGGGTQTAYISALDDRVLASAPAGYITSLQRLIESEGVQDGEQNFYHGISRGIDHLDFLEIRAPKPTLIMATTLDFFSIQGARETYAIAKRAFEIFGKPDNLQITEDDYEHGYTKKNREAMYAFFQKHLQLPGSSEEAEVEFVPAEELQKTTTGQLSTSLGGETLFSLNHSETEPLIKNLNNSRKNIDSHLVNVLSSAKKLSGYITPVSSPKIIFTGRIPKEGYVIEKYFVKGEGDYVIPYLLFIPAVPNNKAVIYLHPSGKNTEAAAGGEIEWLTLKGFTVLAPDLIGTGETGPGIFKGDAYIEGISYNVWYTSLQIGRSIVGIRTGDLVMLSNLLDKKYEIYGLARNDMAPVLLHAAAFNPNITRIALIEPYISYQSIVMNRFYFTGYIHSTVAGALTAYDLPDLAGSLSPRKLFISGILDGMGKSENTKDISEGIDVIKSMYHFKNADEKLKIYPSSENLKDNINEWLK